MRVNYTKNSQGLSHEVNSSVDKATVLYRNPGYQAYLYNNFSMTPQINKTKELNLIEEEIKDEKFSTFRDRFSSKELQIKSQLNMSPSVQRSSLSPLNFSQAKD